MAGPPAPPAPGEGRSAIPSLGVSAASAGATPRHGARPEPARARAPARAPQVGRLPAPLQPGSFPLKPHRVFLRRSRPSCNCDEIFSCCPMALHPLLGHRRPVAGPLAARTEAAALGWCQQVPGTPCQPGRLRWQCRATPVPDICAAAGDEPGRWPGASSEWPGAAWAAPRHAADPGGRMPRSGVV